MRRTLTFVFLTLSITYIHAQTMHSILFANMQEQGREADRTAELRNMMKFCNDIAAAIGYQHDLRTHSGSEFTSTMMEREISTLNVKDGDIVILYYAGHGCNWDDDDWPHMAFLDRQYWETTAFAKLQAVCSKAKLTLCIASCCNMDSRGRTGNYGYDNDVIDSRKAKQLFTGFNGRQTILTSSSIRGQYTYSWSSGNRLGSIYSISLRDEIYAAITGKKSTPLDWTSILEATKAQTLAYTNNKQLPQYKIYKNNDNANVVITQNISKSSNTPTAEVGNAYIEHNVDANGTKCMAIHVSFTTHFMTEYGGSVVAFFDSPQGVGVKDINGKYCTTSGTVCTSTNFGTHYQHSKFEDFKLMIPNEELHAPKGEHTYYVRIFIYDNKSKKYIANGDYLSFSVSR